MTIFAILLIGIGYFLCYQKIIPIPFSNPSNTTTNNGIFNEAEIRKALTKRTAVFVGEFSESVDSKKIPGLLDEYLPGDRQIIVPVTANFKYLFYFDEIGRIECDENNNIKLDLPPIHIQLEGGKIDWNNAKVNISWWRKNFEPEELAGIRDAAVNTLYDVAMNNSDYIREATFQAEKNIVEFFKEIGFDNVIVYKKSEIKIDKK